MPRRSGNEPQVAAAVASTPLISSFARVTKSRLVHDGTASAKKHIVVDQSSLKKRKATALEEDGELGLARRNVSFAPSSDDEADAIAAPIKRACRREEPRILQTRSLPSPPKSSKSAKTQPSRTRTPHRPSQSTIIAKSRAQSQRIPSRAIQTKIADYHKKSAKQTTIPDALPPPLAQLLDLHKVFLGTMMVQLAQNGESTPISIASMTPHISMAWGKREVKTDDIRRCIAIQSSNHLDAPSPFIVSDYGRGKICVELRAGVAAASINEAQLCKQFEDNLRALAADKATDQMSDAELSLDNLSLADLPQVDITKMQSATLTNPLFAKGHRVLVDFKEEIAAKQQQKVLEQKTANSNPLLNPDGTKMSLLDRIRYKQLAKAGQPLPPSGPELERRAALNRVADVAATISMLSLSNPLSLPRQAFTMQTILEKLRDSLRVPLSREEGVACVRLIATEISPEWLRIVTIGGRENIVIQRQSQPIDRVIQERVQKLLG
ncbi:hypothetical protein S40285_06730 [Stachybotrys chlorohalonatus IBT 40285]|uniref:DNA replication factor Cdt1 C-terminal domain-containing protein n=1 Tax=Stachybotrys chlorohalonatus (strain IBT 40285) TaxID=1283841 RepID=A0A084QJD1_STAC4|nr:hypothetical protein S40285_06730 [Stachybotrys chlorohalonata IBT 40285]